jgi:hypothetical protein
MAGLASCLERSAGHGVAFDPKLTSDVDHSAQAAQRAGRKRTASKWVIVLAVAAMTGMANMSTALADEAQAKSLFKAMSDYLAAQKAISFEYDSNLEVVTEEEQTLRIGILVLAAIIGVACFEFGEQVSIPGAYGLVSTAKAVNRRGTLTPDRRPILTPLHRW